MNTRSLHLLDHWLAGVIEEGLEVVSERAPVLSPHAILDAKLLLMLSDEAEDGWQHLEKQLNK